MRRFHLALAFGLVSVLLTGTAVGQLPVGPPVQAAEYLLVSVNVDDVAMKEVEFLGDVTFQCSLEDLSRDSGFGTPGSGQGYPHQTIISTRVLALASNATENETARSPAGWAAGGGTAINTVGGQTVPFTIQVKTSGAVVDNYVRVLINATTTRLTDGATVYDDEVVVVKLAPFYAGRLMMREPPLTAGQYETITYPVEITNLNSYRDAFLLNASAPAGWFVSVPPRVVLEPRETRVVNLTAVTPHDKVLDLGTPGLLTVHMVSENEPDAVYTASTTVLVRGAYLPAYWWPVLLLGLVGLVAVAGPSRERLALRRAERGLPRRPQPTPREAAFLKELKRRDPDAYKERAAAYGAIYASRRELWKAKRKEEVAAERAERRESRARAKAQHAKEAELAAARRKLAKVRAREDAKLRKRAAKEAKRQKKLDKIAEKDAKRQAKRDAKIKARSDKDLAKKRKELEALAAKKAKQLEKARKAAAKRKA